MGTDLYHPGNDMDDNSNNEGRKTVAELVVAIDQRTARIETLLLEPGEGFIPRTRERLENHGARIKSIEDRVWMWVGVIGVLGPILVVFAQKYIFSAVVK